MKTNRNTPHSTRHSSCKVLSKLGLFIALLFAFAFTAYAKDPVNTGLFNNIAIKGYDSVAYFTESKPVKGSKKYQTMWNGANWHFSSEANRDAFAANPEAYAPQYDGYCAWAVSQGDTASIDPDAWDIVDGKLYLNYNDEVKKTWSQDIPNFIRQADKNWPKIVKK